jgi:hypothetical protein
LADLKAYVEADEVYDWDSFKRAQTGRKGKVGDVDFINFLNAQNGWKSGRPDSGETL